MQKRQRDVAELDARYTKELADANATIESLRADVSAGRKRLQVAATCAKSTTGASGMGDGESPRLTADAELNYYRLRSGIDRDNRAGQLPAGVHQDAVLKIILISLKFNT